MGAHPISYSMAWMLVLVIAAGCASEDLTRLNPSIAVCRGADGAACGDSFELGALAVGRNHEQTLYIRNLGAGYLDVKNVALVDTSGEVLESPQSLVNGESGAMVFELEVAAGMQSFSMLIESNDPLTPELRIEFTYDGVQSELVACPVENGVIQDDLCQPELSVLLGEVRRAEGRDVSIAIANQGTASFHLDHVELDFNESVAGEWTSLTSTSSGEMPAERVYLLTFRYQPADEIADTLTFRLYEEDLPEPRVVVHLEAASLVNEPPLALATLHDVEQESHAFLMGTEIWLDGLASFDPEGDVLSYQWTLTSSPTGSIASLSHPGAALSSITLDERGSYEVELRVEDSLGQHSTATLVLDARSEFALEIQATWPLGMGDIDLHMVPLGDALFGPTDCHFQNGTAEWGDASSTVDNPFLMYDTQGLDYGDESVVLEEPPQGIYAIYVHYFEAYNASAVPVTVSVWGEDGETLLGQNNAALAQPCDTVLVGTISWPSGYFEAGDPASFAHCLSGGEL
ncbi:MAG: hypothetical protein HOI23_00385 [Deltaproteobacteria bacterium]|nr:hypothetical protein [Deltaproteobacteria bacterium]